jgi:hypothetical protein
MKAVIATDVIFIIFFIGLVVGACLIIFWKWYASQSMIASEYACRMKLYNYCLDVIGGKQANWNELPPKEGCEKFNIVQPSEEECKKLI